MSGVDFQGLVVDIKLPGPLSGWDLARLARTQFPHIAVVYATGHGELESPAEGVPGSVLVSKPYAPVQAIAALSRQLDIAGWILAAGVRRPAEARPDRRPDA